MGITITAAEAVADMVQRAAMEAEIAALAEAEAVAVVTEPLAVTLEKVQAVAAVAVMDTPERAALPDAPMVQVAAVAMVRAAPPVKQEEPQPVAAEDKETPKPAALAALALLLFTILSTRPHNRKETTP